MDCATRRLLPADAAERRADAIRPAYEESRAPASPSEP